MQTTSTNQRGPAAPVDADRETEQALLVQWQRRASTFAWACGLRLDGVVGRDED